jgi:ketosteroid isomerase-like protein
MADANEDVVRKGYAAFSAGDLDALGQLMTPDVVHSVAGDSLISGEHKGKDEVFGLYGKLFELTDGTMAVELQDVTVKDDTTVIARHRGTATRGDAKLDVMATMELTIQDGKIARLDETFDDQAAEDAFWS